MNTTQKVALVTGANRGIGFETSRQLAKQGITVLMGVRDRGKGEEAAAQLRSEGLNVRFVHLDVNDAHTHDTAAAFIEEKFGKLDILVNNAAVNLELAADNSVLPASQVPLQVYRQTFETNFFNLIALTQKLLPLLKKSEAGRIVNLSSLLSSLALHADRQSMIYNFKIPAYDLSKTALNAFTVHLAHELNGTPIKVNAADPGWVKTDMGGAAAPLEVEDGAKTSVQLATLPPEGPTGGFFHLGQLQPW